MTIYDRGADSARMGSDSHVGAGRGRTLERGTLPGQAGTRRDILTSLSNLLLIPPFPIPCAHDCK
ncbi:hypothetical protein YC2023_117111 [Brassica napus]